MTQAKRHILTERYLLQSYFLQRRPKKKKKTLHLNKTVCRSKKNYKDNLSQKKKKYNDKKLIFKIRYCYYEIL
jgi:hypothetical protein